MKKCTIETTDLNALLDSLTDGEHVKAVWKAGAVEVTTEGPARVNGLQYRACYRVIRSGIGLIDPYLTSFEVTRTEEVTVTRDDEEALHALIDSLEAGETVTAEWRDENGRMVLTGTAMSNGVHVRVHGPFALRLRSYDGDLLNRDLHSVTTHRPVVVQRWERDGDE